MMLTTWLQHLDRWMRTRSEQGSALVEYALLITLIAVVCLLALNYLGGATSDQYSNVAASLASAT